jgi:hypothetical protein
VSIDDPQSVMTGYSQYQSYLLRMWQESPQAPWRVSLQDATTGERRGFSDLESLYAYLSTQQDPDLSPGANLGDGSTAV